MKIKSSKAKSLPDDVYDIVIDASHGGSDAGVKTKEYTEAELVLKCAKELKQKLEAKGYKVFLTRDGTESSNANMSTNMYDDNGRINTAQESHSKILISFPPKISSFVTFSKLPNIHVLIFGNFFEFFKLLQL